MEIVIASTVTPFDPRDGHRLALLSDVRAFLDNQRETAVISFSYDSDGERIQPLCPEIRIPAASGGFAKRLIRGLATSLPPSAERLYGAAQREAFRAAILELKPRILVIDDGGLGGYIPDIRELAPGVKIVLRSHNVMHDVRLEQLKRATGPSRALMSLDTKRYIELEKRTLLNSDHHWAITDTDAHRMHTLYGKPGSCWTVSIPFERYQCLASDQGKSNGFAHIGSLDFRRRNDLLKFLTDYWPRILDADPDASLTLAGDLYGEPVHAGNVQYVGRVKSDADVYAGSRFALNFQSSPGGVKLKTLTSLAAGRTLISTREGVEGVGIKSGREYLDIDDFLSRTDLHSLLNDVRRTQPVADAGRQYVSARHSRESVAAQLKTLLEAV